MPCHGMLSPPSSLPPLFPLFCLFSTYLRLLCGVNEIDLLKSSTPITTAKISNKLRDLAFKLDVEKKLKAGSERLAVLYKNDPSMGDKKNRAGVHGELLESNEKIVLLKRALQKYQQLFVPGMEDDGKHRIRSTKSDGHLRQYGR